MISSFGRLAGTGVTANCLHPGFVRTAAIGKPASGDFERLDSPAIDADLAALAGAANNSEEMAALAPIEQYVATQLLIIPTIADAGFDEYSDANFTGWPSASNPYANSIPNAMSNEVVILHLTPRS